MTSNSFLATIASTSAIATVNDGDIIYPNGMQTLSSILTNIERVTPRETTGRDLYFNAFGFNRAFASGNDGFFSNSAHLRGNDGFFSNSAHLSGNDGFFVNSAHTPSGFVSFGKANGTFCDTFHNGCSSHHVTFYTTDGRNDNTTFGRFGFYANRSFQVRAGFYANRAFQVRAGFYANRSFQIRSGIHSFTTFGRFGANLFTTFDTRYDSGNQLIGNRTYYTGFCTNTTTWFTFNAFCTNTTTWFTFEAFNSDTSSGFTFNAFNTDTSSGFTFDAFNTDTSSGFTYETFNTNTTTWFTNTAFSTWDCGTFCFAGFVFDHNCDSFQYFTCWEFFGRYGFERGGASKSAYLPETGGTPKSAYLPETGGTPKSAYLAGCRTPFNASHHWGYDNFNADFCPAGFCSAGGFNAAGYFNRL